MKSKFHIFTDMINRSLESIRTDLSYDASNSTLKYLGSEITIPVIAQENESVSWFANKHSNRQVHEPGLTAFFIALKSAGIKMTSFLDVGALYGYSSFCASLVHQGCRCHLFESNPRSFRFLKCNVQANHSNIHHVIHNVVISDHPNPDQCFFRIGGMKVERIVSPPSKVEVTPGIELIDSWSLDSFCDSWGVVPQVIKIDVEGSQHIVLHGMRKILSTACPILLIEFDWPDPKLAVNSAGVSNRATVLELTKFGYSQIIWGDHRSFSPAFRVLDISEIGNEQEVNSLGILIHDSWQLSPS